MNTCCVCLEVPKTRECVYLHGAKVAEKRSHIMCKGCCKDGFRKGVAVCPYCRDPIHTLRIYKSSMVAERKRLEAKLVEVKGLAAKLARLLPIISFAYAAHATCAKTDLRYFNLWMRADTKMDDNACQVCVEDTDYYTQYANVPYADCDEFFDGQITNMNKQYEDMKPYENAMMYVWPRNT